MPIASSAQMRRNIRKITTNIKIRNLFLFTFLITKSHVKPVASRSTPAITKSNRFQFISSVICIAINGMSNRIAIINTIIYNLLFCIIINVFKSLTLLAMSQQIYLPLEAVAQLSKRFFYLVKN